MQLLPSLSEAIPPKLLIGSMLELTDGRYLRYATSTASLNTCKGSILILQGYGESIEKYYKIITALNQRGFHIAIFDWSGQGGSKNQQEKYNRNRYFNIKKDVEDLEYFFATVVKSNYSTPYFLFSFDLGGLIALSASKAFKNQFDRIISVSPLLAPFGYSLDKAFHKFAKTCSFLGLGRIPLKSHENLSVPQSIEVDNWYKAFNEQYPDMLIGSPNLSWVTKVLNSVQSIKMHNAKNHNDTPTFFINFNKDIISPSNIIKSLCDNQRMMDCITIMGAKHDVSFHDNQYSRQFWAAFDAFIPGSHLDEINMPSKENIITVT